MNIGLHTLRPTVMQSRSCLSQTFGPTIGRTGESCQRNIHVLTPSNPSSVRRPSVPRRHWLRRPCHQDGLASLLKTLRSPRRKIYHSRIFRCHPSSQFSFSLNPGASNRRPPQGPIVWVPDRQADRVIEVRWSQSHGALEESQADNGTSAVFPGNPGPGDPDDKSWRIHNNELSETKVPSSSSFLLLSPLPVPQQICRPSINKEATAAKHTETADPQTSNRHLEA